MACRPVGELESGALSSSSDSEDSSSRGGESRASLGLDDLEVEGEELTQPSLLSDLDSLTEPSLDSLPGAAREEAATSLEDELMLLRLLELQGARAPSSDAQEPARPQRPANNPIVTSEGVTSIISTLQMELASSGLTADAILAATRHLETLSRPAAAEVYRSSGAAERPCIAPRPSLGRLGSREPRGEGEEGAGLAGLLGESLGALLLPSAEPRAGERLGLGEQGRVVESVRMGEQARAGEVVRGAEPVREGELLRYGETARMGEQARVMEPVRMVGEQERVDPARPGEQGREGEQRRPGEQGREGSGEEESPSRDRVATP